MPEIKVKSKEIKNGINFIEFLSKNKIVSSKSEARRIMANKGFKINDIVIDDEKKNIQVRDFIDKVLKISYGKNKHYLIKII